MTRSVGQAGVLVGATSASSLFSCEGRVDALLRRKLRAALESLQVLRFTEYACLSKLHQLLAKELQLFLGVVEIELNHVGERRDGHA